MLVWKKGVKVGNGQEGGCKFDQNMLILRTCGKIGKIKCVIFNNRCKISILFSFDKIEGAIFKKLCKILIFGKNKMCYFQEKVEILNFC